MSIMTINKKVHVYTFRILSLILYYYIHLNKSFLGIKVGRTSGKILWTFIQEKEFFFQEGKENIGNFF